MAYYGGGPPQPPYPQGSYGQPSASPYPPPQGSPYPPPQQGYNRPPPQAPMSGYPPQGYNQPPYPPQGHSPYPPQQAPYGAPSLPQAPYGAPPQGQYPPAPYGAPSPQPGGYGAPPPQCGSGPPAPPSTGYVHGQQAPVDMSREADMLRSAMKGFGTDEKALIAILSRLDPLQINSVKAAFQQRHRRDLLSDIEKETSGYFRDGLAAIVRGPLAQDVHNLHEALAGLGTKETLLNDVLLSRSNADINAIKAHYQHIYHRSLESDVRGDLSMKTERLFTMILSARRAEESSPVVPQQTDADVAELYRATEANKVGADQLTVCSILSSRSDGQIRALSHAYAAKYHRQLADVLRKNFSGHMEDALLFILQAAEDRAKHDATLLEDAMKGMGTKDVLLVNRVVRLHWDRARLGQAKAAYRHFFRRELAERIRGETRGDYERLMVACTEVA